MIDKIQNESPFSLVSLMVHAMCNIGCDTAETCVSLPGDTLLCFQTNNIDFTGEQGEHLQGAHMLLSWRPLTKCRYA